MNSGLSKKKDVNVQIAYSWFKNDLQLLPTGRYLGLTDR